MNDCEEKVQEGYVYTETRIGSIEIERAHRVKRNNRDSNTNRPRTIVVKLLRFKDKTKMFQNANKLKGQNIFINNDVNSDPDVNFYQNNVSNVEANYFLMTEVESSLASFDTNAFSVLHLNIRSMKKNFENFKEFLKNLSVSFSAICLSETWCESQDDSQNSNHILSGYNFSYQYR